ncbi:MAG: hypothetical protein Athens071416_364 [Parcubacteria group bacterium Athens0714_16]|nr:MAG: hypothetical protein Athens071416_364 [Parcubacteria group bacterium Athens0714_16]
MKNNIYIQKIIIIVFVLNTFFTLAIHNSFAEIEIPTDIFDFSGDAMIGYVDKSETPNAIVGGNNKAKVCKDITCSNPGIINFEISENLPLTIDTLNGLSGRVWGNELGWITFDQGTTASVDPIWGQSTRDEFLLGTFFRTFLSPTDTVILDEKSAGVLYSDGSFMSVVNEFEFPENFQKFTVETKIPAGTSMTAIIESSDDNFATVKSSLSIPLKNGLNNYDAWALKDAKFFRATF